MPLRYRKASTALEAGQRLQLPHRLPGKFDRIVAGQPVAHRTDHADAVGQPRLDGQFRLDQIAAFVAGGANVERHVAPLDAEVLDFAFVAGQPRQAVAQRMDRLAADKVGQRLADDARQA